MRSNLPACVAAKAVRSSVVAIVCSGGNISPAQLTALWPHEPA